MHLLLSCECVIYNCACLYINSGDVTYWHISRHIIGYQLQHSGYACFTYLHIILYSQHPLFSNKTETGIFTWCQQHGYAKKMMMHITWLKDLYTNIRMLG